jgi:2-polyprenyl-6-methoxyphenol hydroxylase-like FAD-dependent oxidoreductase
MSARILIAGGSIGGLTTGLLLLEHGHDVQVFERADATLQARGAGIVVLPVTERYLAERGGDDSRVSLELRDWTYIDSAGRVLSADADRFRFAGWNTIYRALYEAFDQDRYHLSSEMVDFDRRADGVTVRLHDGRAVDGDLLVAADGIGSTVRGILLPDVAPEYAGYVAWRGVVDGIVTARR